MVVALMPTKTIKYWRSKNILDTKGEVVTCTVADMFKFLHHTRFNVPSKNKIPVWAPVSFTGTRSASNVDMVYCLVLDIDDGYKYIDIHYVLGAKYIYVWHTSYSHTPELHKWRLVLPLATPVPKDEWLDYWEAGQIWWEELTGKKTDQVCKDAGRCYYLKASKDNTYPMGFTAWEGKYLDLSDYVIEVRKEKAYRARIAADLKRRQQELIKSLPKEDQERIEKFKKLNSKEARTRKAYEVGATIKDGMARNIKCPKCNRRSVWFGLDPNKKKTAECNHKKSCGWFGFVNHL